MRAARLVAILVCVCGCPSEAMPPFIPDDDSGGTPPIHPLATCGFNEHTFSLPTAASVGASGTAPFAALSGSVGCTNAANGTFDFEIVDVDGDGRADLLVTTACNDPTVGPDAWLVYPNISTGFDAAVRYELPLANQPSGCVEATLVDIDGDAKLDYVVTSLCTDTTVGTTRWVVYRNTGGAFDSNATSYALPGNAALHTFSSLEVDAASCTTSQPAFAFYDITGDGLADIVETTACDDASVGVTNWRVYPGSATGVTEPIAFALPGVTTFPSPGGNAISCTQPTTPAYVVVDFDGDLKPDLVVTKSCTDTNVGSGYWDVYKNTGTNFNTQPAVPTLPALASAPTGAFDAVAASTACTASSASLNHTLVDVDGDLKPDLVVTSTCSDATIGVTAWVVYPNTGTTFGGAFAYTLPPALDATQTNPANALAGTLACASPRSSPAYDAAHLLDARLDIIMTQSCSDATLGASRWLLYTPTCPTTSNDP